MEDLSGGLRMYLTLVEKLCLIWEGLAKRANKHMNAIEILSDQLQSTSSVGRDVPISDQFPGLEEQVAYKTLMSLEQELVSIISIVHEVSFATEKLNKLASKIDHHREVQDITHPTVSVGMIFELAFDCRQYYQAQFLGLQTSLKCLDYRDSQSVKDLRKSFMEDKDLKKYVQRCILAGKYFVSEIDDSETLHSDDV